MNLKKFVKSKNKKPKEGELPLFSRTENPKEEARPLSVSEFLDKTNANLAEREYRVQGEIGRVQSRGSYLFCSLKDTGDESTLNCFAWGSVLSTCGIKLEEGLEVVVTGYPEIYKRTGGFNFQIKSVELVGEGTLKKAFDKLKKKLEEEGLFEEAIKKPLPKFPKNIALVTSRHGEAINDFNTNIGQFGFKISLVDSRVEGQRAVFDILEAIRFFNKNHEKYDALVLIRGGGSWESLQAFNNEKVAYAIRDSNIPVVCGVGHEGDVTIADLASDFRASTPTAAAKKLSENWVRAQEQVLSWEDTIINGFTHLLANKKQTVNDFSGEIKEGFSKLFRSFEDIEEKIRRGGELLNYQIKKEKDSLEVTLVFLFEKFYARIAKTKELVDKRAEELRAGDPKRQLKLGYNIALREGRVVRSVDKITRGDTLEMKFWDGQAWSRVEKTFPNGQASPW